MSAPELLQDEAAEWVVRLGAEDAGEAEHAAFMDWLATVPGARSAYDRALDLWLPARRATPPVRQASRAVLWGRVAASLAFVLVLGGASAWLWGARASSQVLRTGTQERRDFTLADGSRITLAPDSCVIVRLGLDRREVVMKRGDAVFHVAAHLARGFQVIAGDDALHAANSEFGVHRRDGRLRIVVRSGQVAIGPAQGQVGPRVRLPSSHALDHKEGTEVFQVAAVNPESAFAW